MHLPHSKLVPEKHRPFCGDEHRTSLRPDISVAADTERLFVHRPTL